MLRISVSLEAYEVIASALPKGLQAKPPEPMEVGKGVALWIDHETRIALDSHRGRYESYSDVILRLAELERKATQRPVEVAARAKKRLAQSKPKRTARKATT